MDKSQGRAIQNILPFLAMAGVFVLVDGLSLLVASPLAAAGGFAFENPSDPMDLVSFFLTLLIFTGVILFISRYRKRATHGIFLGAVGLFFFCFFYFLTVTVIPEILSLALSISTTVGLLVLLLKYPEWYVIDASGIIMAAGSIGMFGISLNISLVIILLAGMAVYDAISVYKTKHMLDLADTVMRLKVPAMLIIPKVRHFSIINETKGLKEKLQGEERNAFYIGLGDIVFPGILFSSAYYNVPSHGLIVAASVTAGTLLGFVVLMRAVIKGKPQAGLPFLSSGAILGYMVSSYLIFGRLVALT